MNRKLILFAALALAASGPVFAQQTQPMQPAPNTVNDRRTDQQDRIANGVQSGQLTAGETRNIESREANLNREVRDDRSADGGKLTQQERNQVNRQQNNLSRSIYNDKHNANNDRAAAARQGRTAQSEKRQAKRTQNQDRPHR